MKDEITKKIFGKVLSGFPIGVTMSIIVNIIVSLFVGQGRYLEIKPEMVAAFGGGHLTAYIVQFFLSGFFGSAIECMSLFWISPKLSISSKCLFTFVILCATLLPIGYICYWMGHTLGGFFGFMIIVLVFYAILLAGVFGNHKKAMATLAEQEAAPAK